MRRETEVVREGTAVARVLLADDTPDLRALLKFVLSRQDDFVVVAEAADGKEAVDLAVEHRPDVVLLDLAMPVLDGLEAIPGVRAAVPDAKIIVLSGFDAGNMAAEAVAAGADAYLEKATPAQQLVHELRRICGMRDVEAEGRATLSVTTELAGLNHELMNALAVIEGFASLLERRPEAFTAETVGEHAATIGRSTRQLRSLLQAVADARRLEIADLEVTREDTDLVPLVHAAAVEYPAVVVDAPETVVAFVDPVRLRQVVDTLLSNAAKLSPPGAPIEVRVTTAAGWVNVSVHDQSRGVPLKRRVGLFIAQGIARVHGGDISLVETTNGGGTTLVLRLPLP